MAFKVADRVWETTTTSGTGAISLGGAKNGSTQAFSAALANGDECYYCVTDNSTVWEVGLGTFNTGTPDTITRTAANVIAGSSGAGALITLPGTSCDVFLTAPAERALVQGADGGVAILPASVTPATPATGLKALVETFGNAAFLSTVDSNGVQRFVDPEFCYREHGWFRAQQGSTNIYFVGIGNSDSNGTLTASPTGLANILQMKTGVSMVSAATAGAFGGREFGSNAALGTGTGQGFLASIVTGCLDAATVSGAQSFVGLQHGYGFPTAGTEPSALLNCIGIGQISTDATQWYLCYGGTTAQTAIALGTALGAPTDTTTAYWVLLYSPPTQNGICYYYVENLATGASVSGTLGPGTAGVTLPATSLQMYAMMWRGNNATAAAVSLKICSVDIYTDY